MKKSLLGFILGASLFLTPLAEADNAVGVVIGDPTGFSGRLGLDNNHSLAAAIAYTSGYYEGLYLHVSYLWDNARQFRTSVNPLELYYGLGLRVITIQRGRYDGDTAIGPRAPIGLLYNFNNPNIEVFGELSLALDFAPRSDVDLDAGVGARVRF